MHVPVVPDLDVDHLSPGNGVALAVTCVLGVFTRQVHMLQSWCVWIEDARKFGNMVVGTLVGGVFELVHCGRERFGIICTLWKTAHHPPCMALPSTS